MGRFLARRTGESLFTIWGVVTTVFFITRVLGDPATLFVPVGATDAQIAALNHSFGLDLPLWRQYLHYLAHVVRGDFGRSFVFGRPAIDVVMERLPATALLAATAMALGCVLGCTSGAIAAMRKGSLGELVIMTVALLGQATPVFWLGLMLILWFAVDLHWLPAGGYGRPANLVLPAVTLAVFVAAAIARLTRSSILDILREDHVRTARAKGLYPATVFFWHIARNALVPVTTMVGLLGGELLGGSVVTETVFGWPGMGRLTVQAIESLDFPVIQAAVFVAATLVVLINLAVDLLYQALDPRIRAQ
ncbi:MAG: ABC transporter permease [Gluconacetobacter sp.]|uniref:ABC transporter permease n=2 Tax=Gluconacetobacter TaxID=89583 RepID=A0A370G1Q2_GLULI|nr:MULTISPECIES: ABC transporter permease [Gluconacetobacter]GBQ99175.1 glutathione ABC transporter permease [Gluconacetobacter liquefaciens NRIC 0522]MBB2187264.1 ABC transporter permease [Gluconacetobacter liquefaciens]MBB2197099.1 ABC transporter permease [Gluconacetobacter dulcium]RDI36809.1 peptide/nickel transport system permease protein [Gluconacetobacter liquefaciens]GEB38866.1 glutathione ABC transporter permease [Gluconacetobacter liquefaciens]